MYSICEWAPCSWAKNEQILKISRFLLLWQLGCNFFSRTFFTYRLRHSMRNIKRSIFSHIKHPLKRPPSGRKVSSTVKSASPCIIISLESALGVSGSRTQNPLLTHWFSRKKSAKIAFMVKIRPKRKKSEIVPNGAPVIHFLAHFQFLLKNIFYVICVQLMP